MTGGWGLSDWRLGCAWVGVGLGVAGGGQVVEVAGAELVFADQFEEGATVFAGFTGGLADVAVVAGEQFGQVTAFEAADQVGFLLMEGGAGRGFGRAVVEHELFGAEAVGVREQDGAFDDVFQFADIAGPGVGLEAGEGGGGEVGDGALEIDGVFAGEVLGEQGDVLAAVAEGWEVEGEDVEAVEEVGAEAVGAAGFVEVGVGGGDDADIGLAGFLGAEAAELLFLEEAEEFDLGGQGEAVDFVEEEGAGLGQFDEAGAAAGGAGEGAGFVAEEFVFDQVVGDGAAVDGDEGFVGAGAEVVDGAGEDLLAGAGFTGDEDAGVALGDGRDLAEFGEEGWALADDMAEAEAGFEFLDGAVGFGGVEVAEEAGEDIGAAEGRGEVVAEAGAEGGEEVVGGEGGVDEDPGDRGEIGDGGRGGGALEAGEAGGDDEDADGWAEGMEEALEAGGEVRWGVGAGEDGFEVGMEACLGLREGAGEVGGFEGWAEVGQEHGAFRHEARGWDQSRWLGRKE